MRVVLAPDKFAGSLSAVEVAAALADGVRRARPDADVVARPMADGGDGTVDAAVAAGWQRRAVTVDGPTGEPVEASYARRGDRAVVELADACGRRRLVAGRPAPLDASSFGVGQVLARAVGDGARRVVLGIGGSASTDGGAGLLAALGARLLDADGAPVPRGGRGLPLIERVDLAPAQAALAGVELDLAGDVDSPLLGPEGAAAVFGPQKGATGEDVRFLEAGLRHWADLVGGDPAAPGAGAAGGVGFAVLAVLGGRFRPGVEMVAEVVGLPEALAGADLVITGEGALDRQTARGKTVAGVARLARLHGVPAVAVAGRVELADAELRRLGIADALALDALDRERCFQDAARLVAEAADRLVRRRQ